MCRVLTATSELAELGKELLIGTAAKTRFETSGVKSIVPCSKVADKRVCTREFVCTIHFRDGGWMSVLVSKLVEGIKKFSIGIRHFDSVDRLSLSPAALKRLFTIHFFEGVSHLVGELTGLDMRVVLANDPFGVVNHSGGGRMS